MPEGIGYGSKRTKGGGTKQQNASGTPGLTPGGDGGTTAAYRGQPTSTGERGSMGPCGSPNELRDNPKEMSHFPMNHGK